MSQAYWDFCILYWLPSSAQLCMLRHEALDNWGKQQKTRWVKSTHAEWTEELSHNIQASSKSHDYYHCSVCLWYHQIPWNLLPLVKPAGKPQSNVKICRCLHFFLIVKKTSVHYAQFLQELSRCAEEWTLNNWSRPSHNYFHLFPCV